MDGRSGGCSEVCAADSYGPMRAVSASLDGCTRANWWCSNRVVIHRSPRCELIQTDRKYEALARNEPVRQELVRAANIKRQNNFKN